MIISDLEYLEVVGEEIRVEGGVASVATAAASSSATGDNSAFSFSSANTFTQFIDSLLPFFPKIVISGSSATSEAQAS